MTTKPAERTTLQPEDQPEDDLLATRPRVRRDVLYSEVPEGVLFHDATTGFRVHGRSAYRFATLVVPHLEGSLTVAQLCAGLGDAQRAMVQDLVRTLYRRGFARPARVPVAGVLADDVRRRFAAQIAYVDHHVDDAESRFARFRAARVAVVGTDEIARWAALSLVRNGGGSLLLPPGIRLDEDVEDEVGAAAADGCPVDVVADAALAGVPTWADLAGADVVLVTPGTSAERAMATLLDAGVPAGKRLLPAWSVGGRLLLGPLHTGASVGCWECAALRIGASAEPGAAVDLWRAVAGSTPRRAGVHGPIAAMAGNLMGYEVFRLLTGALPGETVGRVVVQDTDSLDVQPERLLPHPDCSHCPAPPAPDGALDLTEPSTGPRPDRPVPEPGSEASRERLTALENRSVLVGRVLGPVASFQDDELPQTPLRLSAVDLPLGPGLRRRISSVDVHTVVDARLTALATAAQVYADHVVPLASVDRGTDALRPDDLATHGGTDPEGLGVASWASARSLTTGRTHLVPAGAAAPFSVHNDRSTFLRSGAGIAADAEPAGARTAALLSALALDTLVEALHERVPVRRVQGVGAPVVGALSVGALGVEALGVEALGDPVLTFLSRTARTLGAEVELLELGSSGPAPVLLARAGRRWTVSARTTWSAAAITALRDLLGTLQIGAARLDAPGVGDRVDLGDPVLADLDASTLRVDGDVAPRPDLVSTPADVLAKLAAEGRDALVVDRTSADLAAGGLSVVRVLLTRRGSRAR